MTRNTSILFLCSWSAISLTRWASSLQGRGHTQTADHSWTVVQMIAANTTVYWCGSHDKHLLWCPDSWLQSSSTTPSRWLSCGQRHSKINFFVLFVQTSEELLVRQRSVLTLSIFARSLAIFVILPSSANSTLKSCTLHPSNSSLGTIRTFEAPALTSDSQPWSMSWVPPKV